MPLLTQAQIIAAINAIKTRLEQFHGNINTISPAEANFFTNPAVPTYTYEQAVNVEMPNAMEQALSDTNIALDNLVYHLGAKVNSLQGGGS